MSSVSLEFSRYQNRKFLNKLSSNSQWKLMRFSTILSDETKFTKKIKKGDYLIQGKYPIIDQGKEFIAGYSNSNRDLYNNSPVVIFGDHTRILKYIDFPIFIGADGVKLLKNSYSEEEVITKFVYYYLLTTKIPDTGYNRHFKFLKDIIVPIPRIDLQRRITCALDKAQFLIDKRKTQIEALDQLTQSVFLETVINNKAQNIQLKFVDIIEETRNGLSRRGSDNNGEIVLRLRDIRENNIDYSKTNRIKINESEKKKFKVDMNDLLLIRVNGNPNYVGRSAVFTGYDEEVYFNDHIIRIKVKGPVNEEFIAYYLNSHLGKGELMKNIKTSAGQFTINRGGLNKINIILPPIELQNQFAQTVQKIEAQKSLLQQSLTQLENNFQSLMQRAFRGELFTQEEVSSPTEVTTP